MTLIIINGGSSSPAWISAASFHRRCSATLADDLCCRQVIVSVGAGVVDSAGVEPASPMSADLLPSRLALQEVILYKKTPIHHLWFSGGPP
jgi:hypothetical protein